MVEDKEFKKGTDRPKEAATKPDVFSADEHKSVQEKAAVNAAERKQFLGAKPGAGAVSQHGVLQGHGCNHCRPRQATRRSDWQ